MTPTLHPCRHWVDTFLVNEPSLTCSLRERVWDRGMAHLQVAGSDQLLVRQIIQGLMNNERKAAVLTPYSHIKGRLRRCNPDAMQGPSCLCAAMTAAQADPPLHLCWALLNNSPTSNCRRWLWTRCSNTATRHMSH